MKSQRELREHDEWRGGRRKGINEEFQLLFYARPHVKYSDRKSVYCMLLQPALVAHLGFG